MISLAVVLTSAAAALAVALWLRSWFSPFRRHAARWPGTKSLPLFGDVFYVGFTLDVQFRNIVKIWRTYGDAFKIRVGPVFLAFITHPKDVEIIISSARNIEKKFPYVFLYPWLGSGLLTSGGAKWHKHRKLITPAFHFKILEHFVPIFNKKGEDLMDKLRTQVGNSPIDIQPFIELYTQDVICETAMGVEMNAQKGDKTSLQYVQTVRDQNDLFMQRIVRPWCILDFVWKATQFGKRETKNLQVLHETTYKVIRKRKENTKQIIDNVTGDDSGRKRRLAFLDLLILASEDNRVLSDQDIREEVDTFMFEGHDTTVSGVSFTLYELSRHQDIQEKVLEELKSEMGDSLELSLDKLNQLKYLEWVIKEGMRLYPPVPNISRTIPQEVKLVTQDLTIPEGCSIVMSPYMTHRNPEFFPEPEKFDPERFQPENCAGRHPYAYIPFSAGPRNCIGQKFAMLEMKSVIAKVIWNYKLFPAPNFEVSITAGLTLKSSNGIKMIIDKRN